MAQKVYCDRRGPVAVVYINRPEVHNCIDDEAAALLNGLWTELDGDDGIDVVILTGVGDKAFSTGLDLRQLAAEGPAMIPKVVFPDTGWCGIAERHFSKPIIAAVNGYAIAGGLELVLSTDFAIAADTAQLGFNEATLGPLADAGACFRLPNWVPLPFAREMLLTGRLIGADEAYRVGLVNRVVPQSDLLETCLEVANRIAANSPAAMKSMKRLVAETLGVHESQAWPINNRYMVASFDTPDFLEGPRAFTEKRPARFRK